MGTVILEGPDNSGKTTLAYALVGWMGPDHCQYVKSPASKQDWDETWDEWNAQHVEASYMSGLTYILDRTPEISELVYGPIMRGYARLNNPLKSLKRLNRPDTFIIMTSTGGRYDKSHTDYLGNVTMDRHISITNSYQLIDLLMRYDGFQVGVWDYKVSKLGHIAFRINQLLQPKGLDVMDAIPTDQYYIDKGKEIVNAHLK